MFNKLYPRILFLLIYPIYRFEIQLKCIKINSVHGSLNAGIEETIFYQRITVKNCVTLKLQKIYICEVKFVLPYNMYFKG